MTIKISLRQLLNIEDETIPDMQISGLSIDNRTVQSGMAFIALQGTQQHGLQYAVSAVEAGASVVLYEPSVDVAVPALDVPVLAIENLSQRLGELAAAFYQTPSHDLFMVGITGTDGKTSVSHFIAQAMNALELPTAVIGTMGNGLPDQLQKATHTTPDAICVQQTLADLKAKGASAVAMEVSSHALDQGRVNAVNFDVAVLTNLTRDHLDYHKTVEAYAAAKRQLFDWGTLQTVVLNLDDAFGVKIASELDSEIVSILGYGVGELSDYPTDSIVATKTRFNHQGIWAEVHTPQGVGEFLVPVLGSFNLHNLLATLGVLLAKGVELEQALAALQQIHVVAGRVEPITEPAQDFLTVVDFAHTPDALRQVLKAIRTHTEQRLICVFGCGGDRDRGKRPLMAQAAEELADIVVVTDDNPRTESQAQIFADITAGLQQPESVYFEHDRAKAIRLAVEMAQAGDTVLIAGKGHETEQIFKTGKVKFDDREQARLALGAR